MLRLHRISPYMNDNYDECKKNFERFLYTKSPTLFKKLDNSRHVFYTKSHTLDVTGFSWNFWIWHLCSKSMTLCVAWRFYISIARHFAKARQFAIRFYIKKSGTFALRGFSLNFWNLHRWVYYKIQCTLRDIFILKKQTTLRYVAIYKEP